MKEKIYTILINELMDEDGCPFCLAQKRFEENALDYFLGPAMMEPDVRLLTNKIGFCQNHAHKMLFGKNRLSLALMLHTRTLEVLDKLSKPRPGIQIGCAVCDKIQDNFSKFTENFAEMLKAPEFFEKYKTNGGTCLPHFLVLSKKLSKKEYNKVKKVLIDSLSVSEGELFDFCKSFDYRSDSEIVTDAPERALKKLI